MGNIDPSHRGVPPTYKQEFETGLELFRNSLLQYSKATEPHQKDAFKQVMQKALAIMNQSAKASLGPSVQNMQHQLEVDFQNFLSHEDSESRQKLLSDIQDLKGISSGLSH